ncbi:hypothetical protein [Sulfurisphaera tokodaii]|uniref:Uncharacterized protein n=2 Tax=Sulfurisphaera tokodaii TaxID=111955 RepID=Q970N5_SULTO|nr:hypothetical protein [Sulfurisphaera tokodaii]BAB66638.1 hypothetical protein STK_15630 [Sulfurisphaera tokodaii str. 7]HII73542.1 hypothetical protein [Sulfurisphaera tokodaii]
MNFVSWLLVIISFAYSSSLCVVSKIMKSKSKLLGTKIKKLLALKFIEMSADLLSTSEFAELMEEVSFLTNLEVIDKDGLFHELYQKFPRIEKELKEVFIRVSLVNKIDYLAKDLERKAFVLRIAAGLMFISVLGLVAYFDFCPYISILSIVQYTTTGLMIILPLIIFDSLKTLYQSDKIIRDFLREK